MLMIQYFKQNVPVHKFILDDLERLMDTKNIAYTVYPTKEESHLLVDGEILDYDAALKWAERFRD